MLLAIACHEQPGARDLLLDVHRAGMAENFVGRLMGQTAVTQNNLARAQRPPSEIARLWARAARAQIRLEEAGRRHEAITARGVSSLLAGRTDEAVERLERAVAIAPTTEALNDLAVAYLNRARSEEDSLDLLRALTSLQRAGVDAPEILFNRALVLTELHLRRQAAAAWKHLLAVEPAGTWTERAAGHLSRVQDEPQSDRWMELAPRLSQPGSLDPETVRRAIDDHPYEARNLCERVLLLNAAESADSGERAQALAWLQAAGTISRRFAETRHDELLVDEIERFVLALSAAEGAQLGRAAEPLLDYFAGLDHYDARNLDAAEVLLRSARTRLAATGSPLALAAALRAEICLYYRNAPRALGALERLLAEIPHRYSELRGRTLWMMGIAASSQSRYDAASRWYAEAAELVEKTTGKDRAATLELLLADNFDRRGEVARAWKHRRRALARLAYQNDPQRRYGALIEASQTLGRNGEDELALLFLHEASATLADYPLPFARAEIAIEKSQVLLRLDRSSEASRELDVARGAIAEVEDSGFKSRLEALSRLTEGLILLPRDAAGALERFASAEHSLDEAGLRIQELLIELARAEAHRSAGDAAGQRQALVSAVETLEETRRDASEAPESVESFRRAQSVFDRLILEALKRPDGAAEAFAWAERSRSQTVLDLWRGESTPRRLASLRDVRQSLPGETTLLEYATAGEDLLCWVFEPGRDRLVRLDISRAWLERRARDFRTALESRASGAEIQELGVELHRALIAPLELVLADGALLVVVADGPVRDVPFSALVEPSSRRFLVERAATSTAPSATLFLLAREKARRVAGGYRPLLVGIDTLSSGPYAHLPSLPFAQTELAAVSAYFPDSLSLSAASATRARVVELLPRFDALHFTGHGLSSKKDWNASGLLLSPESAEDDGMLRIRDLLRSPIGGLRLVTLSACETLRGYEGGREGTFGLATAFFAAGVPSVVGSRWKVGDRGSNHLMQAFYRHLKSPAAAVEALRQAKLECLRSPDPALASPSHWAAFELIGG